MVVTPGDRGMPEESRPLRSGARRRWRRARQMVRRVVRRLTPPLLVYIAPFVASFQLAAQTDWSGWAFDGRLLDPHWWIARKDRLLWLALLTATPVLWLTLGSAAQRAYDPADWKRHISSQKLDERRMRNEGRSEWAIRWARWKEHLELALSVTWLQLGLGTGLGLMDSGKFWEVRWLDRDNWLPLVLVAVPVVTVGVGLVCVAAVGLLDSILQTVRPRARRLTARAGVDGPRHRRDARTEGGQARGQIRSHPDPAEPEPVDPMMTVIADRWLARMGHPPSRSSDERKRSDHINEPSAVATRGQSQGLTTAQLVTLWYATLLVAGLLVLVAFFEHSLWPLVASIVLVAAVTLYTQGPHPAARKWLAVGVALGLLGLTLGLLIGAFYLLLQM